MAGLLLEVDRCQGVAEALRLAAALAKKATEEQDEQAAAALKLEASQLEETARKMDKSMYVDDAALGGSKELVESMVGGPEANKLGHIAKVLSTVGVPAKYIVQSGDNSPEAAAHLGKSVLGIDYQLKEDRMSFDIQLKFRIKVRGGVVEDTIMSRTDVERLRKNEGVWTRRKALSFLMQV